MYLIDVVVLNWEFTTGKEGQAHFFLAIEIFGAYNEVFVDISPKELYSVNKMGLEL